MYNSLHSSLSIFVKVGFSINLQTIVMSCVVMVIFFDGEINVKIVQTTDECWSTDCKIAEDNSCH